jgi:cobalt-zinc-cadmium efflux system outer membrane protein
MRTLLIRLLVFAAAAFGTGVSAQTPALPQAPGDAWTLDAALAAALNQHPLVESARAQGTATEGKQLTAGVFPNPVATYWVENLPFSSRTSATLDRESSIYATWPLEPLVQRSSRVAQARGEMSAAQASITAAEQRVATDTARAFFRVALAQASVDAARDNLAATEQVVEYLRNRVAQGATPEGELIRAQVERDRAATEVTMADVDLLRAQSGLRLFLGDAAGAGGPRVSAPDWRRERAPLAPLNELTAYALAHRSDLLASRAKTAAATSAVEVERSMVVRQLGASFGVKRMAGVNGMVGGISLTVPLFDQNRGEIQRTTGERLAAELETRWLERTIATEIEAEYHAAERLANQVTALQPSFLSRAEESRRIALGAYQEGATSLLQVLDASRALNEARVMYARVLAAANESLFVLGIVAGYDPGTAATLGRRATDPTATSSHGGSR